MEEIKKKLQSRLYFLTLSHETYFTGEASLECAGAHDFEPMSNAKKRIQVFNLEFKLGRWIATWIAES